MSIPTGYERLAVIGIAWKGEYAQSTVYKTMNGVYYKGSTYVALRDNPTGPPSADGANWQYLTKGFEQQLLSAITALDTSGVLGQTGATVGGQALIDAIADKVMTKLVERSAIVQTESTSTDKVPSSAYFKQVTDRVISDLIKVAVYEVTTPSIAGESDVEISITLPQNGNIIGIIPVGFIPAGTWDTVLFFKNTNGNKISVRTQGLSAQSYLIKYCVLYTE